MRRIALCVAATLLPIGMFGCGGSGESGENQIPGETQFQLGQNAQGQLRVVLNDKSVLVQGIRCGRLSAGAGVCILQAANGAGERGTITIAIKVERRTRSMQAQLAGTSNRHWMAVLRRASGQPAEAGAGAGAGTGTGAR